VLRRRLIEAGILDARASGFLLHRPHGARGCFCRDCDAGRPAIAAKLTPSWFWMSVLCAGMMGYMAPSLYLDRRIKGRQNEHRAGFPDFMDLWSFAPTPDFPWRLRSIASGGSFRTLIRRLAQTFTWRRSRFAQAVHVSEALEHLADRLGLEEARQFATLLQQSAELGSSLTDALRVYSDDMRHKRLSSAEEKAYSLPAKLSVPLVLCIFRCSSSSRCCPPISA
jgi:tight adherence protein C